MKKLAKRPVKKRSEPHLKRRFRSLVRSWKTDRGLMVSIQRMAAHPAYQEIIALGPPVIPLLLAELEREPDHWFWALHSLTGAKPVPETGQGKIDQMADAWLQWGKKHGYEW